MTTQIQMDKSGAVVAAYAVAGIMAVFVFFAGLGLGWVLWG